MSTPIPLEFPIEAYRLAVPSVDGEGVAVTVTVTDEDTGDEVTMTRAEWYIADDDGNVVDSYNSVDHGGVEITLNGGSVTLRLTPAQLADGAPVSLPALGQHFAFAEWSAGAVRKLIVKPSCWVLTTV